jgi:hypothetical protein
MQKFRRIDLDLGYREPRRYIFRVGEMALVLREPSFSHIELCKSLQGMDPASQEMIQFLDWTMDDLTDIMDFCQELPMALTVQLVTACREVFACSDEVEFKDFKAVQEPIGRGNLRRISADAIRAWKDSRDQERTGNLLERLGVVIKPRPKGNTGTPHKEFAWLPLTAVINPASFDKIQKSLSYDPETWDEEMEARNKVKSLDDPDERDREFGGNGNTQREVTVSAFSGDRGVSLTMMPKAEFVALMQKTVVGFIAASQDGVDMRTYRSAMERNMNPKLLAERDAEMQQPRDSELQKLEESQDGTVTVRSRWRGRNRSAE